MQIHQQGCQRELIDASLETTCDMPQTTMGHNQQHTLVVFENTLLFLQGQVDVHLVMCQSSGKARPSFP